MNTSTKREIERLKNRIPPKDIDRSALFIITRTDNGFQIDEIISNDFAHIPEAFMGDEKYLVAYNTYDFTTVQDAVAFVDKKRNDYHGVMPCLAILGGFTRSEIDVIHSIKKMLFLNHKYLAFLYGICVPDELKTRIIE